MRALGGQLLATTWSERLFVFGRRLCGVRLKLLVLLAAEVIGIGFYGALASHLPRGGLRAALEQMCDDERAHLRFHQDFFRTQAARGWRRQLFRVTWNLVAPAAALVVLWDHRRTLRLLGASVAGTAGALAPAGGWSRAAGRAAPTPAGAPVAEVAVSVVSGRPPAAPAAQALPSALPAHVAIIMDGNGRWAHQPRAAARARGTAAAPTRSAPSCARRARSASAALTLYAFSAQNWSRPGTRSVA